MNSAPSMFKRAWQLSYESYDLLKIILYLSVLPALYTRLVPKEVRLVSHALELELQISVSD